LWPVRSGALRGAYSDEFCCWLSTCPRYGRGDSHRHRPPERDKKDNRENETASLACFEADAMITLTRVHLVSVLVRPQPPLLARLSSRASAAR
jgi:hypothetical protein